MTTISSEPAAGVGRTPAFTSLRRLRLSVLLASLPFGMLTLGLLLVARQIGASSLAIGGLFAVFALVIVAVQPVVGFGGDRYGRRAFLIAGLLGYALSNAICGLASGMVALFLAQLAQGIGSGLLWLAAMAIVPIWRPWTLAAGSTGAGRNVLPRDADRDAVQLRPASAPEP